MNLPDFSIGTLGGKLLRLLLRSIPASTCLPILRGPSRGRRWVVGSSNHGCWLGSYEYEQCLFSKSTLELETLCSMLAHTLDFTRW